MLRSIVVILSLVLMSCTVNLKVIKVPIPINGVDGRNGLDGKDGVSCTVTQEETGSLISCTDGSYSLVLNGINGEQGIQGPTGDQGIQGPVGATGADGAN